jgi:aerotaxis receptor
MTKKMQTGSILNAEIPFDMNELFFSRTNAKGILAAGNDVFVRVSGWARSELLGRPHNVIRHPDMPRTIFQLFWEKLKAGSPIAAYVKNLAADGRYYWVLAAAFPIADGYMSIRLKPTSPLLAKVRELYLAISREEKGNGLEGGRALLIKEISALGYASYEDFMTKALITEMNSRTAALSGSLQQQKVTGTFTRACQMLSEVGDSYAKSFARLATFRDCGRRITECTSQIIEACHKLEFVCYNMTASAARLEGTTSSRGGAAAALAVISDSFRRHGEIMKVAIAQVEDVTRQLASAIAESEFDIASGGLQINMLDFYVRELASQDRSHDRDAEVPKDIAASCRHMVSLLDAYTAATSQRMQALAATGARFRRVTRNLQSSLMTLGMIKETGKMEVARVNDEAAVDLNEHIRKLGVFVVETEQRIHIIEEAVTNITSEARNTVAGLLNSAPRIAEAAKIIDTLVMGHQCAPESERSFTAILHKTGETTPSQGVSA